MHTHSTVTVIAALCSLTLATPRTALGQSVLAQPRPQASQATQPTSRPALLWRFDTGG